MTLKVKVNASHFQYQLRESKRSIFGENVVIVAQIHKKSYGADKSDFLEFWVKMTKMTLEVKVIDLHFQYQLRVSQNACLVQIWWF